MKIAVIGANGKAGSLVVKEALKRGHEVTAIVRDGSKAEGLSATKLLVKDLFDLTYDDVKDNEVIVDAFGAWTPETIPQHITATKHLCDILSGKDNRLLVVGGAGSLYMNPEHCQRQSENVIFRRLNFVDFRQEVDAKNVLTLVQTKC